ILAASAVASAEAVPSAAGLATVLATVLATALVAPPALTLAVLTPAVLAVLAVFAVFAAAALAVAAFRGHIEVLPFFHRLFLTRRHRCHPLSARSCTCAASSCGRRRIRRSSCRIPCHARGRRSASRSRRNRARGRSCPA